MVEIKLSNNHLIWSDIFGSQAIILINAIMREEITFY
jgi:hypothetical protein